MTEVWEGVRYPRRGEGHRCEPKERKKKGEAVPLEGRGRGCPSKKLVAIFLLFLLRGEFIICGQENRQEKKES